MQRLAAHLAFASIFLGAYGGLATAAVSSVSIVLSVLHQKGLRLSRSLVAILAFIFFHGIINILAQNTSINLFITTALSTTSYFICFYLLLRSQLKIIDLLAIYMRYGLIVATFGYLQIGCWALGASVCYDYSGLIFADVSPPSSPLTGIRINSFLAEPSQVAFTMGPLISLCIIEATSKTPSPLTSWPVRFYILAFVILSQSSAGYMVLLASVIVGILIGGSLLYILTGLSALLIMGLLIIFPPEFLEPSIKKGRALMQLVQMGSLARDADATTWSIYYNGVLGIENMRSTFLLGGGLGSHEFKFGYLEGDESQPHRLRSIGTAANLVIRLTSELGLIGLTLFVYVVVCGVKLMISQKPEQRKIVAAMLVGVFAFVLRNGSLGSFALAFCVVIIVFGFRSPLKVPSHAHRQRH